jgi:hypothetical protein
MHRCIRERLEKDIHPLAENSLRVLLVRLPLSNFEEDAEVLLHEVIIEVLSLVVCLFSHYVVVF